MTLFEIAARVSSLKISYNGTIRRWGVVAVLRSGEVWGSSGPDLEEICRRIP